jgi:hypothetical protein
MNNNPISLAKNLVVTTADTVRHVSQGGPLAASSEKIKLRMDTCAACQCFDAKSKRCNLCGCFMELKVKMDAARCPASKW